MTDNGGFFLVVALLVFFSLFLGGMFYMVNTTNKDILVSRESCENIGGDMVYTEAIGRVCITENAKYVRSGSVGDEFRKWVRWDSPTGGRD